MTTPLDAALPVSPRHQLLVRAEQTLRRGLRLRRLAPLLLLAALPLAVSVVRAIFLPDSVPLARTTTELGQVFHVFILRFVVFFSCAAVFVRLFRGEILDRCIHHTLLTPVPRAALVAGTWLGGLATTVAVLVPTTAAVWVLFYLPHGAAGSAFVLSAAGLGQLLGYLLVVVLACAAYGAFFTLAGLYFKNPMVPAILFLGWELLTPFLPAFLKALSLVHYLASFEPVPPTAGPFALVARPVPAPLALLALALATGLCLAASAWKASRLEVTYSAD